MDDNILTKKQFAAEMAKSVLLGALEGLAAGVTVVAILSVLDVEISISPM